MNAEQSIKLKTSEKLRTEASECRKQKQDMYPSSSIGASAQQLRDRIY